MKNILAIAALLVGYYFLYYLVNPTEFQDRDRLSPSNRFTNGSFVFYEEMLASEQFQLEVRDSTIYQILEGDSTFNSIVLLEQSKSSMYGMNQQITSIDDASQARLLEWVYGGGNLLMAYDMYEMERLCDSLGLENGYQTGNSEWNIDLAYTQQVFPDNEAALKLDSYSLEYIRRYDTLTTEVILTANNEYPVMVYTRFGEGAVIFTQNVELFENYYMLNGSGSLIDIVLGYLPIGKALWVESRRGGESFSLFKYFQQGGALAWAYYLSLFGVLLFLVSSSRRRQRAIPQLSPKTNDTLQFATNISKMYRSDEGYFRLATKRYNHWKLYIKRKYGVKVEPMDTDYAMLSKKTATSEDNLRTIVSIFRSAEMQRNKSMDKNKFMAFNNKVDEFYRKEI